MAAFTRSLLNCNRQHLSVTIEKVHLYSCHEPLAEYQSVGCYINPWVCHAICVTYGVWKCSISYAVYFTCFRFEKVEVNVCRADHKTCSVASTWKSLLVVYGNLSNCTWKKNYLQDWYYSWNNLSLNPTVNDWKEISAVCCGKIVSKEDLSFAYRGFFNSN